MERTRKLVEDFRNAIDKAHKAKEFCDDHIFRDFPLGCCGVCSELLGHFLIHNGIETNYVCGNYRDGNFERTQSHAWLETMDGVIIDITGDQFKYDDVFLNYNIPVYIGECDDFHGLFEVHPRDVHKSYELSEEYVFCFQSLKKIYNIIIKYMD